MKSGRLKSSSVEKRPMFKWLNLYSGQEGTPCVATSVSGWRHDVTGLPAD